MILGITGGFGCGKSSILRFFGSHNWFVFDADSVCRSFYESAHPDLIKCIRENFGNDFFTSEGYVDRAKLSTRLFSHPEEMKLITGVLYPLLTGEMIHAIDNCRNKSINGAFELPLLYEAGFEKFFDSVLAVWCPAQLRKARLRNRNFTPEEVDRRDKMQIPPEEKLERADFGVINNGSLTELEQQLSKIINRF